MPKINKKNPAEVPNFILEFEQSIGGTVARLRDKNPPAFRRVVELGLKKELDLGEKIELIEIMMDRDTSKRAETVDRIIAGMRFNESTRFKNITATVPKTRKNRRDHLLAICGFITNWSVDGAVGDRVTQVLQEYVQRTVPPE